MTTVAYLYQELVSLALRVAFGFKQARSRGVGSAHGLWLGSLGGVGFRVPLAEPTACSSAFGAVYLVTDRTVAARCCRGLGVPYYDYRIIYSKTPV